MRAAHREPPARAPRASTSNPETATTSGPRGPVDRNGSPVESARGILETHDPRRRRGTERDLSERDWIARRDREDTGIGRETGRGVGVDPRHRRPVRKRQRGSRRELTSLGRDRCARRHRDGRTARLRGPHRCTAREDCCSDQRASECSRPRSHHARVDEEEAETIRGSAPSLNATWHPTRTAPRSISPADSRITSSLAPP
jgi:hypothetical protein